MYTLNNQSVYLLGVASSFLFVLSLEKEYVKLSFQFNASKLFHLKS